MLDTLSLLVTLAAFPLLFIVWARRQPGDPKFREPPMLVATIVIVFAGFLLRSPPQDMKGWSLVFMAILVGVMVGKAEVFRHLDKGNKISRATP